ncbi:DUF2585 domain-containing protein [Rhizobium sp.]
MVPQQQGNHGLWTGLLAFVSILLAQIVIERLMGRIWICECGTVKLWEGGGNTSGNSQHIADWYTLSHIIHGFLFYWFAWLAFRGRSVGFRLGLATLVEAGWEILENSPLIIERYRSATMALNYFGDSILNSAMDNVWMAAGFLFAWRMPVWLTVSLAVIFELLVAYVIRDNLTLNVIMLVWPVEAIKVWQGGG